VEEVPYYGMSWFFYLLAAAGFMLFSSWKTKSWSAWIRIPMLCFFAAMAFTPTSTMQGEGWWSPAAIVMVFEIDQNGFAGFWRAGLAIIVSWILLIVATLVARWQLLRMKRSVPKNATIDNSKSDLQAPE